MPIDNAAKLMSHPVQHYARSIEQNTAAEQRDDATTMRRTMTRVLPHKAALRGRSR
jgi:hypothetical protein